jgi:hypothetical protein
LFDLDCSYHLSAYFVRDNHRPISREHQGATKSQTLIDRSGFNRVKVDSKSLADVLKVGVRDAKAADSKSHVPIKKKKLIPLQDGHDSKTSNFIMTRWMCHVTLTYGFFLLRKAFLMFHSDTLVAGGLELIFLLQNRHSSLMLGWF